MSLQLDAQQFLELLQAAAQDAGSDAARKLPQESFTQRIGFRWADKLRSIDCDDQDREAWCVHSTTATLVTQQVLTKSDACEFVLQVENVGGEGDAPIFFGVVDAVPTGFGHLSIGHSDLKTSIGISGGPTAGAVVHGGEIVGPSPGIKNGDIVKIKISQGSKCALFVGSREVTEFTVGGDGKFRCAVSMSSKGQRVKILAQSSSPSGSGSAGLDLLQQVLQGASGSRSDVEKLALAAALAQLVEKAGGDDGASKLPKKKYSRSEGFTWVDTLRSVNCDPRDKMATCVRSMAATMVTKEVLTRDDECDFILRVVNVGGEGDEPVCFGVVDDVPNGFSKLPIGHPDLKPSIGACCTKKEGAIIMGGERKRDFPALNDGDIVKIHVGRGSEVSLFKGAQSYMSFKVQGGGRFRLGATFNSKGQKMEILDAMPDDSAGGQNAMKVGCEVTMPPRSDPRLSGMRTKYSDGMGSHCGRTGKVVRTSERCIRTSIDGTEYWWDIELFPRGVRRCCHEGCELSEVAVTSCGHICDVCMVRLPKGSKTWQCRQHDYDVCAYCNGLREVPSVGSKVIRGPTWKWKEQDGTPYTEGVCKSAPDSDGWVSVQWAGGSTNKYRVSTHYQDVWAAHDNGLAGQKPVPVDDEEKKGSADLGKLLGELLKHVMEKDGSSSGVTLPSQAYAPETGFTFVPDCVPEVEVGASKKDARAIKEHPTHWGSIVTEQVVEASSDTPVVFSIQIKAFPALSEQGTFAWGICTSQATNFQKQIPGTKEFKGSMGCIVTREGGVVFHDGNVCKALPDVASGDMVGARFHRGRCELLHQGRVVYSVGVKGNFRFVVCLGSVGQHVVIQGASTQSTTKTDFAKSVPHVDIGKGANQLYFTEDEASKLGQGGFGVVYRGKLFGDDVVVKKMLAAETTDEMQQNFEQEVQALAALRHKNLVIFLGINAAEHLIVTEFCELGDLKNYMENQGKNTSADHRRGLMLDTSKGMACIAGHGMVHRDLKPENVLLSAPGPVAKIGDFGLVMPLAQCRSDGGIAGSLLYMAPEVFLGQISEKSDVYAFSLVLGFAFGMEELDVSSLTHMNIAVLVAQIKQDPALVHHVIIDAIRKGKRPQLKDSVPAEIKTLVKEGWHETPEKRPTFVSLSESLTQPLSDSIQADGAQQSKTNVGEWRPPSPPLVAGANEQQQPQQKQQQQKQQVTEAPLEKAGSGCCSCM